MDFREDTIITIANELVVLDKAAVQLEREAADPENSIAKHLKFSADKMRAQQQELILVARALGIYQEVEDRIELWLIERRRAQ